MIWGPNTAAPRGICDVHLTAGKVRRGHDGGTRPVPQATPKAVVRRVIHPAIRSGLPVASFCVPPTVSVVVEKRNCSSIRDDPGKVPMVSVLIPQKGDRAQTIASYRDANASRWPMDKLCGEPVFRHSARCRLHCPGQAPRIHVLSVG